MLYADGKPGTNWFVDEDYRGSAFDSQKYAMIMTVAYFAADALMIIEEFDRGRGEELLLHHILAIPGCLASLYLGGHVFSLNYLNFFVEVSTIFVNVR